MLLECELIGRQIKSAASFIELKESEESEGQRSLVLALISADKVNVKRLLTDNQLHPLTRLQEQRCLHGNSWWSTFCVGTFSEFYDYV